MYVEVDLSLIVELLLFVLVEMTLCLSSRIKCIAVEN